MGGRQENKTSAACLNNIYLYPCLNHGANRKCQSHSSGAMEAGVWKTTCIGGMQGKTRFTRAIFCAAVRKSTVVDIHTYPGSLVSSAPPPIKDDKKPAPCHLIIHASNLHRAPHSTIHHQPRHDRRHPSPNHPTTTAKHAPMRTFPRGLAIVCRGRTKRSTRCRISALYQVIRD